MTYSLDFRQKVFAYKAKKELTFEQTSEHFDIGIRTLFRWQSNMEPCSTRNKPATKIDMEVLAQEVEDSPDDYQWERAARFNVTQPAITKALKRLNISYKKNTTTSQGQRRGTYQLPTKNKGLSTGRQPHRLS